MFQKQDDYIPALKYEWLTSWYDLVLQWTMRETSFKPHLVRQAQIKKGQRILDLGCGTATLTLLVKQTHADTEVIGLDGDPRILQIATAKSIKANLNIGLDYGLASNLSYPDNTFDRVLSSLFFHHLTRENKVRVLREVLRVLRPGGEFHVADWGKAQNWGMRLAFLLVQMLDGFETTTDNVNGLLPALFAQAGFAEIQQSAQYTTIFGTLALYKARKPG